jgi:hypothetical protein
MKEYSAFELNCFDLVDQILKYCIENDGGSFFNINANECSSEQYSTFNLLIENGLVVFRNGKAVKESVMDVSPKGFDVIRNGGFKSYILARDTAEEKKKQEAQKASQKLENDLWLSARAKKDYRRTRIIAYVGFGLSVLLGIFQIWKLFFGKQP